MVQDSEIVRWSYAFLHVFVFTVKKRCVLFIDIAEYALQIESFLCRNKFLMPARNYKAQSYLAIKIEIYIES